jgi:tetratricopeptide (TPR) repeat protein
MPPVNTGGDVFSNPEKNDVTLPAMLYVSGKVVVDDGTPLTERALIQSNCHGLIKTEGYTDAKGTFSIQFSNREFSGAGMASDTATTPPNPSAVRQNTPRDWRECELKAVLAGFVSNAIDLGTRSATFGNNDVGTIVLHRMAGVEGFSVSATSSHASGKAKKDYEKGLEEKKNGKLDNAQERFQKAVESYPQYASAWLELGRVQVEKKDIAGARGSFHKAIAADAKFISPYQELAQLAAREKQWQELADTTDQMLKLDALEFPQFWFYNCVAKYYLGNLDAAENSAHQGIKIDAEHHVPKLEYVLGILLVQKHDYPGAAEHLHKYLSLAPNGPDAADAQKRLEEAEKLSAAAPNQKQ